MTDIHVYKHDIKTPYSYLDYVTGRWHYSRAIWSSPRSQRNAFIAFPEPRKRLIKELNAAQKLGKTIDNKTIYLVDYHLGSSVIRELGRLRELTFRAVGEGTRKNRDTDRFDKTYRHIVLWDNTDQEIVGAYRIGEVNSLTKGSQHLRGLYTHSLFDFRPSLISKLPDSIELGRSFIQPKYWTQRGLDMLWQGIGAYLAAHPHIRYLFGAVSLSNEYPEKAKHEIVAYYQHYFQPGNARNYAVAKRPFTYDSACIQTFRSLDLKQGIKKLKHSLKQQNVSIPTLLKHYTEFCEPEGISVIDFNIDPDFSYCIDGLILADLTLIKAKKYNRYLKPHLQNTT